MTQPIRGEVVRVLNQRKIAINIGSNHGVTIGMYFDVMNVITDPDTNEVLGPINRPAVRMKVTRIREKCSVVSTYKSELVYVEGLAPSLGFPVVLKWVRKYETLAYIQWVGKYEILVSQKPFDEEESRVKTGDLVVQVFDVDAAEAEDIGEE